MRPERALTPSPQQESKDYDEGPPKEDFELATEVMVPAERRACSRFAPLPVEAFLSWKLRRDLHTLQNEVNSTMPEFKFKYALNLESEEKTKTILAEEQMFENLIKVTVDEKYNIDFYAKGKLRFLFSKICQELKKFGIDFLKTKDTKVKNVFLTLRELLAQITSIRLYRHYLTYLNLIKRYVNRKSIESGKQIMK